MKTLFILILCQLLFLNKSISQNPCNDSVYLELSKIPMAQRNGDEYSLHIKKEKDCFEYQKKLLQNKVENQVIEQNKFPQSLNSIELNKEQIKIYNRNKITIEIISQSIGNYNNGLFNNDISSTSWYQWTAYIGFGQPISEDEFFKKTGYNIEGKKAKQFHDRYQSFYEFGFLATIGGLAVMSISEENEKSIVTGNYKTTYTVKEYPYQIVGSIISGIGAVLIYSANINSRRNFTPYNSVKNIADEYNEMLIKNILEGKKY